MCCINRFKLLIILLDYCGSSPGHFTVDTKKNDLAHLVLWSCLNKVHQIIGPFLKRLSPGGEHLLGVWVLLVLLGSDTLDLLDHLTYNVTVGHFLIVLGAFWTLCNAWKLWEWVFELMVTCHLLHQVKLLLKHVVDWLICRHQRVVQVSFNSLEGCMV